MAHAQQCWVLVVINKEIGTTLTSNKITPVVPVPMGNQSFGRQHRTIHKGHVAPVIAVPHQNVDWPVFFDWPQELNQLLHTLGNPQFGAKGTVLAKEGYCIPELTPPLVALTLLE